MNIRNTIAVINQMQADGVIERYAPARPCVFTAEHLAAIPLQTGRAKDKARLLQFVETGALDPARFQAILSRHGLQEAWQRFEKQFLGDTP